MPIHCEVLSVLGKSEDLEVAEGGRLKRTVNGRQGAKLMVIRDEVDGDRERSWW
jgi:hypothetical protein